MLIKNSINTQILTCIKDINYKSKKKNYKQLIIENLIFKDLMFYLQIWRQIRGFSKNNQRSHSNNKNNKKIKLINKFRLNQFYQIFGKRKREIYPTLILAEYTNRLWFLCWRLEWFLGWMFMVKLAQKSRNNSIKFDPYLLSKNIITGVVKKKKKKKHNAVKRKEVLSGTIGLPIFFSLYLYNFFKNKSLPFKLVISDEVRKKLGKKKKKKKKK